MFGWQSNATAVGDSLVVDNKTLSDVVKGVSKLTVADATSRSVAGTATAAAAAGVSPASHVLTPDTASSATAATSSCNAAVVAPASHRFEFMLTVN